MRFSMYGTSFYPCYFQTSYLLWLLINILQHEMNIHLDAEIKIPQQEIEIQHNASVSPKKHHMKSSSLLSLTWFYIRSSRLGSNVTCTSFAWHKIIGWIIIILTPFDDVALLLHLPLLVVSQPLDLFRARLHGINSSLSSVTFLELALSLADATGCWAHFLGIKSSPASFTFFNFCATLRWCNISPRSSAFRARVTLGWFFPLEVIDLLFH